MRKSLRIGLLIVVLGVIALVACGAASNPTPFYALLVGGGAGSTGCTIANNGDLTTDGDGDFGGTLDVASLATVDDLTVTDDADIGDDLAVAGNVDTTGLTESGIGFYTGGYMASYNYDYTTNPLPSGVDLVALLRFPAYGLGYLFSGDWNNGSPTFEPWKMVGANTTIEAWNTGANTTFEITNPALTYVCNGAIEGDWGVGVDLAVGGDADVTGALTLGTALAIAEGGTGATSAGSARTNLGLGTLATQDADSVNITGGSAALDTFQVNPGAGNAALDIGSTSDDLTSAWLLLKPGLHGYSIISFHNSDDNDGTVDAWVLGADMGTDAGDFKLKSALIGGEDVFIVRDGNRDVEIPQKVTMESVNVSALNSAPANAADTGNTGEIRFTSSYIYVCVGTDTWKRVAISSW